MFGRCVGYFLEIGNHRLQYHAITQRFRQVIPCSLHVAAPRIRTVNEDGDGVMSGSVLLLKDGTIAREYTHGDLALYRLSSKAYVEGGKSTRSIVPPTK